MTNPNEPPDAGAKGEGETSKLLPCPMCNGRASVVEPVTCRIWRFYIRCKDCGMRTENLKSKDYAIAAWNRRFDAALTASCEECERLREDLDRMTQGTWSKSIARQSRINADLRAQLAAALAERDKARAEFKQIVVKHIIPGHTVGMAIINGILEDLKSFGLGATGEKENDGR